MSWISIVFLKEKTSKIASSNCSLLSSENEKKKNLLRNCTTGAKKAVVMFNFFKTLTAYLIWVSHFGLRQRKRIVTLQTLERNRQTSHITYLMLVFFD